MMLMVDVDDPTWAPPAGGLAALQARGLVIRRIGGHRVAMVEDDRVDLLDQVRSWWPCARSLQARSTTPLTERATFGLDTVVAAGGVPVGGPDFVVMAGPCAVEGAGALRETAAVVAGAGAQILRGGAFKPRTTPHAFQGSGHAGLALLATTGREFGLPVISEVVDPRDVECVAAQVDILQVGARNAQNFSLLSEVGRSGAPVLLKRGFGCTVEEWLGAAEYVLAEGNPHVILCERGIRSFESATRFTLDLAVVPVLKQRSHLPVVVDPSHATGHRDLVAPMALAAAAAGADGLLIDVHTRAASTKCDGPQALNADAFGDLMLRLRELLPALGRTLSCRRLSVAG
ncbi:MAG: 3-deoxy-7-phosphoheptulonate synthase [Propionibacteriaceae bacterium]